jgi:hypothetical protein
MKSSPRCSWLIGFPLVGLLACSGGVDSGDQPGGGSGAGSTTGQAGQIGAGGGTTNPSGGSTANPSGGASNGGTTAVAGSASGGTSGAELCSSFPLWDKTTVYPMNAKVYYAGSGYIAGNGGDATAVNQSLDPVISTWWWQEYPCEGEGPVGAGGSGNGGSGGNPPTFGSCEALDDLLGGAKFYEIFTLSCNNVIAYSYDSLCEAVQGFPSFANTGDAVKDKRELAAFLAHAAKETWFLHWTTQTSCQGSTGTECGRGPIQITGWSNYQGAGEYLGLDLANNPTLVATDPVIGWKVALWYWNVHSNPGAGSPGVCHEAMNQNNFGQTTRIINGGIECAGDSSSACKRAEIYTRFCQALGNTAAQCTEGVTLNCNGGACGAVTGDCG